MRFALLSQARYDEYSRHVVDDVAMHRFLFRPFFLLFFLVEDLISYEQADVTCERG